MCVTKLCVSKLYVKESVTKLCVSKLCVKERGGGGGGGGGRRAGYRIKPRTPHKDVGNKNPWIPWEKHTTYSLDGQDWRVGQSSQPHEPMLDM